MKYKVTIEFEYDSEEGAPLTGNEINSPEDAIQAVRDELESMSPNEFIMTCESFDENDVSQGITKG
jgi:hypothetical protein